MGNKLRSILIFTSLALVATGCSSGLDSKSASNASLQDADIQAATTEGRGPLNCDFEVTYPNNATGNFSHTFSYEGGYQPSGSVYLHSDGTHSIEGYSNLSNDIGPFELADTSERVVKININRLSSTTIVSHGVMGMTPVTNYMVNRQIYDELRQQDLNHFDTQLEAAAEAYRIENEISGGHPARYTSIIRSQVLCAVYLPGDCEADFERLLVDILGYSGNTLTTKRDFVSTQQDQGLAQLFQKRIQGGHPSLDSQGELELNLGDDGNGFQISLNCFEEQESSSTPASQTDQGATTGGSGQASGGSGGTPTCASADSDPDGDGWGWENGQSCRVQ